MAASASGGEGSTGSAAASGKGAAPKLTPMMEQYQAMRHSLPKDILLFYRLGDFYEMFFEDAKKAAALLNVALTKRNGIPMCGVPHHSAEGYIAKAVKAGMRIAIAEQTSEPQPGKIVEREIAQIISAGTIDDINLLDDKKHNYLAAVFAAPGKAARYGLAYVDHSTGEFRLTECPDKESLFDELARIRPSELLYSEEQPDAFADLRNALPYDGYTFIHEQAQHLLVDHFKVQSLDGFGCTDLPAAVSAAGAILHYLENQLRRSTGHVRKLQTYARQNFVLIDAASQQNLDLVESRSGPGTEHTLLGALDKTATPMGGRKLRDWILHPLRDLETLVARQDLIAEFLEQPFLLTQIQESLKNIRDVERTLGRLSQGSGNARDLLALSKSLQQIPALRQHLEGLITQISTRPDQSNTPLAHTLLRALRDFTPLTTLLEAALDDEPPATIKDGGIFRDGYSPPLDELRSASREGKQWIAELQARESERTGIPSLKVKYNNVFGYFIEVTKTHLDKVPDDFQRKQTMVNAERFITPELKEFENKILGADERARNLEYEEYLKLRERVLEYLEDIQNTAEALATLDVLCGLAATAQLYQYTRPVLANSRNLIIKEGRHPVLDQNVTVEKFVPNDTHLEPKQNRVLLITGPNMAGKSTYIRQVALLTLMAQIGSFIPAHSAEIGLVDRIFTRVGASDDISKGQSTFMVEMNETALIVNNATDKSLVILDEIGRGTATFDGLSIAWSVAEYLHDTIKARTLFATHYHELTSLSRTRDAVQNYNIAVREWNEQIIFLRKIVAGAADKSYGIQVARLAGLPDEIIHRSKEILNHLEANSSRPDQDKAAATPHQNDEDSQGGSPKTKKRKPRKKQEDLPESETPQLSLFQ
ncbi:MAG: DNA mismatch repair protein MutS [Verrucomicrobiota bacterium]